jgi:hypothetical protein
LRLQLHENEIAKAQADAMKGDSPTSLEKQLESNELGRLGIPFPGELSDRQM